MPEVILFSLYIMYISPHLMEEKISFDGDAITYDDTYFYTSSMMFLRERPSYTCQICDRTLCGRI